MPLPGHIDLPRHESYGLVRIARIQGSKNLFGSPIRPLNFIRLTITEGSQHQGLGSVREMDGPIIAEIDMSEMQFAELITTPNSGVGTPCTLAYAREGDRLKQYEEPPQQTSEAQLTREEFRRNVEERMATMKAVKRRIDTLMEEGSLAKSRRMEIGGEIDRLLQLFTSSAPFFMERFEENAERVVATAKAEITAHAELVLRNTGIQALGAGAVPMLNETAEPERPAGD